MSSPSKKYSFVLMVIAACLSALSLLGLPLDRGEGYASMFFGYLPYVCSAAFLLTIPVSLIWLMVAAALKRWQSVRHLVVALAVPVISGGISLAVNWRILNEMYSW